MKVELKNVYKYYERDGQKISILNDVNLTVNEGESVALLGPTGCGKSTLIYMIAGLRFPDSGAVLVDGKAVEKPGHDRVVMFQDSALFPWLTVLGNVEFGLRMMGMGKEERRQKSVEMLKMVHLSRFINAYPHELSGGMKQR
ncbi:MAG: ATP-binding cassette domain-containing protein, partial [Candidatus Omnitrophica bacterium]|nr:ATP-binding cassette domain-containing protein [Candidatus Omnitrophota bacterium]